MVRQGASFQIWVQVPLCAPDSAKFEAGEPAPAAAGTSTWDWWNRFRLMADSHNKINLCLGITEQVPTDTEVQRWLGEPVKTVSQDYDISFHYLTPIHLCRFDFQPPYSSRTRKVILC